MGKLLFIKYMKKLPLSLKQTVINATDKFRNIPAGS